MSLIPSALRNQKPQPSGAYPMACVRYALNQFLSSRLANAVASTFTPAFNRHSPSGGWKSKWPLVASDSCSKGLFVVAPWVAGSVESLPSEQALAPSLLFAARLHSYPWEKCNRIESLVSHCVHPFFCLFGSWFCIVCNWNDEHEGEMCLFPMLWHFYVQNKREINQVAIENGPKKQSWQSCLCKEQEAASSVSKSYKIKK